MSTAEAPSHLRENPLELARHQLRSVGKTLGIDPNLINVLETARRPSRSRRSLRSSSTARCGSPPYGLAVRRVSEATVTRGLYP